MAEPTSYPYKTLARAATVLVLLAAAQAAYLVYFICNDTRPPSWDQAVHLEISLDYLHALKEGRISSLWRLAPKPGMPPFPPLYHLALLPTAAAQRPEHAALWANLFYAAILSVSLFSIGWSYRKDLSGAEAACLLAGTPALLWLLQTQLPDLSIVALAAAGYWALLVSDRFHEWGGSISFGAVFAAGMLHKWSFFSYFFPAYWIGWSALRDERTRAQALAAAGLALALFSPWYLTQLPVLVPRLFQAASDSAIPFWRESAYLSYPVQLMTELGLPLFLLCAIGLLIPLHHWDRRRAWLMQAWFLSTLLFWTVVPNRQMRFLAPGLPALMILAAAHWPKALVWGVIGLQAFTGANYIRRWVEPVKLQAFFFGPTLFPSSPPVSEQWFVEDILSTAEKTASETEPLANLTLLANDVYFNGPTFDWARALLNLRRVRVRGVNKRLCELSQYLLLKTGKLAPPSVLGRLEEAAKEAQDPDGWFKANYLETGSWLLPDGSKAFLYRRAARARAFAPGRAAFPVYDNPAFSARDFTVEFSSWSPASGYHSIRVAAKSVELRGLTLSNPKLILEDAVVVPVDPSRQNALKDVRLLKLGKLRVESLRVDADSLRRFLEARVRGLSVDEVRLNDTIAVWAKWRSIPLEAQAQALLSADGKTLDCRILSAKVAGLSVGWLVRPFASHKLSLEPNSELPFFIEIPGLKIAGQAIEIATER